jgi:hypothetical protein
MPNITRPPTRQTLPPSFKEALDITEFSCDMTNPDAFRVGWFRGGVNVV